MEVWQATYVAILNLRCSCLDLHQILHQNLFCAVMFFQNVKLSSYFCVTTLAEDFRVIPLHKHNPGLNFLKICKVHELLQIHDFLSVKFEEVISLHKF